MGLEQVCWWVSTHMPQRLATAGGMGLKSRKRCCQTKGQGGGERAAFTLLSSPGKFQWSHFMTEQWPRRENRRDKAAPSLPACGESKRNPLFSGSPWSSVYPLRNIIGTMFSQDSLLGSAAQRWMVSRCLALWAHEEVFYYLLCCVLCPPADKAVI